MLTGLQIREARKLLQWDRATLSRNTFVTQALINAIESSDGPAWMSDKQEADFRRAYEAAGIRFEKDAKGELRAMTA
ncbi:MAG: hypothetical protein ACRYGP_02005 [Janthinobacterium lividum]